MVSHIEPKQARLLHKHLVTSGWLSDALNPKPTPGQHNYHKGDHKITVHYGPDRHLVTHSSDDAGIAVKKGLSQTESQEAGSWQFITRDELDSAVQEYKKKRMTRAYNKLMQRKPTEPDPARREFLKKPKDLTLKQKFKRLLKLPPTL